MSRYSRIFLRPKEYSTSSESPSSSAKYSTAEPITSSSYSYPPSSQMSSSPPPHPYTIGAFRSASSTTNDDPSTISSRQRQVSELSTEKPPTIMNGMYGEQQRSSRPLATVIRSHGQSHHPHPERHTYEPSLIPHHIRPFFLLFAFLPVPPVLSLLYLVSGHAILRATHSSSSAASVTSYQTAPLISSVEAGATGGVVLSIPLALLLYLLLFPTRSSSAPEDFFEDDDSSVMGQSRWLRYTGYTFCVLFVLGIGGVAGPLGVTCLGSTGSAFGFGSSSTTRRMLTTSAAAAAGLVGGVVLAFAALAIGVLALVIWTFSMRRKNSSSNARQSTVSASS